MTQRLCGSLEEAAPKPHAPDHRWSPAPLSPSLLPLSSPLWPDEHQAECEVTAHIASDCVMTSRELLGEMTTIKHK